MQHVFPSDLPLTGPVIHENLALYFLHGRDGADGTAPLTLDEAMAKGVVHVYETSDVWELEIENLGDAEVFINAGDMVKGGRQDRVLTVSLTLSPLSGRVPISAFCVEQGRWEARGKEDVMSFSRSEAVVPSRHAKLAMRSSLVAHDPASSAYEAARRSNPQGAVWDSVVEMQRKLHDSLGENVAAPESESSLQLSLENRSLQDALASYVEALRPEGEKSADIVGFVFAINGLLNSAEVYSSNELFRKLWPKLLHASATEAVADRPEASVTPPAVEAVSAFLAAAEKGEKAERRLSEDIVLESRVSSDAIFSETKHREAGWTHRNYVAR